MGFGDHMLSWEALTEETIEVVIKKLKKVVLGQNVINVGFAMDALSRI